MRPKSSLAHNLKSVTLVLTADTIGLRQRRVFRRRHRAVIEHPNATGKKAWIDPKRTDLTIYRSAHLIPPNRKELCWLTVLWLVRLQKVRTAD